MTTTATPTARYGAAMGYAAGEGIILFGGSDESDIAFNQTWVYTDSTWTRLSISGPFSRTYHSLATAPDGAVYLFGGNDREMYYNDLWRYANGTWTDITPGGDLPSLRTLAAMTNDFANDRLLLFGGRTVTGTLLADLWAFDLDAGTWQQLDDGGGDGPSARMAHSLTYDPDTGNTVLVGGVADAGGDTPAERHLALPGRDRLG